MFTLIYLNILAPLNQETDPLKQNTDSVGGDAQSLEWYHIFGVFTTCLQEEKADAFKPPKKESNQPGAHWAM